MLRGEGGEEEEVLMLGEEGNAMEEHPNSSSIDLVGVKLSFGNFSYTRSVDQVYGCL